MYSLLHHWCQLHCVYERYKEISSIRGVQDIYEALLSQIIVVQVNGFNFKTIYFRAVSCC